MGGRVGARAGAASEIALPRFSQPNQSDFQAIGIDRWLRNRCKQKA
jgi:hypothetical protein